MHEGARISLQARCPVCAEIRQFTSADDYWSCRDDLRADDCPLVTCSTRHRALAAVLFSIKSRAEVANLDIHESSPAPLGLSLWLRRNCPRYVMTGFFPDQPAGTIIKGLRNEDLERQTFPDASFDIVLHLDVLEHLFEPLRALAEIARTLRPEGYCLFTAPTYPERTRSEQVAFKEHDGLRIVGKPEYHGNPQSPEGSIVTWRYGYDLPRLIAKETGLDAEVRRWHARTQAILGPMTEVYVLRKPGAQPR